MNYISLGFFCSVAEDLEKLGLRNESSPFDWVISDLEGVMLAIRENFIDLLNYKYLAQSNENHTHYKNLKYDISFFHDFNKYVPLQKQLAHVEEKYKRRIHRFYKSISEPTLFIRYISTKKTPDGKIKELIYLEENYEQILATLKSFNKDNDILFIADDSVLSTKIEIHHVAIDENDTVARSPIYKNPVLLHKFNSIDFPNRQANINRYLQKEHEKNKAYNKVKRKLVAGTKKIFLKEYIHEHQY